MMLISTFKHAKKTPKPKQTHQKQANKKADEYEQYSINNHFQEFHISIKTEWKFLVQKQHISVDKSHIHPPCITVAW